MRKKQVATSGLDWLTMIGLSQQLKQDKLYRDYMLLILGSYFGLRISDLLKITFEQIIDKSELVVVEQKSKKRRTITINNNVSQTVTFCLNELRKKKEIKISAYIFSNRWGDKITTSYVNKRLKIIFRKYKVTVKAASSHILRKTFGRRVYEMDHKSERALVYLSEIFSHSSIAMTRKYIGITQEQISDIYMSL